MLQSESVGWLETGSIGASINFSINFFLLDLLAMLRMGNSKLWLSVVNYLIGTGRCDMSDSTRGDPRPRMPTDYKIFTKIFELDERKTNISRK